MENNEHELNLLRDNIEEGATLRLDLKNAGYGGLRVFYAYKMNGAYYIDDYTAEKTMTMRYQITDKVDILLQSMKRFALLHNWTVLQEEDFDGQQGAMS